ncbi:MAG TPA: hypothetical protein VGR74_13100 [Actinomycetota bacterium]|nr:hypothetical protein [Actinomycetota bacterium]
MAEPSTGEAGGVGAELRAIGAGLSALELVRENFDDPRQEWRRLFAESSARSSWSWPARAAVSSTP